MVNYSVLHRHTKKFKKTSKGYIWYLKERGDLKVIHNENDVLNDGKLVVARDFFKKSKYACVYIRNEYPRGFKLLNHI